MLTHDDDRALLVQDNTVSLHMLSARLDHFSKARIKGIGEADVSNNTALEEGEGADTLCAVDDLVRNYKVHGLDLLLQRTDGGEGDDASDTDMPQGSDIGSVGDFVGGKLVVDAMSGEEGYVDALVGEDLDGRRGSTPRCDGVEGGDGLKALKLAKTSAANDGNMDGL